MCLLTAAIPATSCAGPFARHGEWVIEILKRSDTTKEFVVFPRQWVVERTFAWLGRNRRLAKDFEKSMESSTAWIFMASVQLMTRRLANP
jgi:transposase